MTPDLIRRLDRPGPRYTSYPTADRFVEAFGVEQYRSALRARRPGTPLSVYVHIPFCESVCYYCACNKVVTRRHERAAAYLDALETEIALHEAELGERVPLAQLHLGGGTPTFLSDPELTRLMRVLRRAFAFAPAAELSIEVDPRTAAAVRLAHLADLGFNRLSLGVQDVDARVQEAVHRVQGSGQITALLRSARAFEFRSTNIDLIYGLPMQTPASFARTIEQVCEWQPDRIALYAYAHLPERFKPQRRIDGALLPNAAQKIAMLSQAIDGFMSAGYEYIGMDHFARPDDALAVAKRQGRLRRNFQGYTTQPDGDLVGLGVSAISRIGATYSQNAKGLNEYHDAMQQHRFATARGLALTRDDLVRRSVIMALMCQGRVEFESIALSHLIDFRSAFAAELAALEPLQASGLVVLEPDAIEVTSLGWYFVRSVAMVFDRHLRADQARVQYSKLI